MTYPLANKQHMTDHDRKQWRAERPANIALIKYMGKQSTHTTLRDAQPAMNERKNWPCNPSLSYTLNQCRSEVVLVRNQAGHDRLFPTVHPQTTSPSPKPSPGFFAPTFTPKSQVRFLSHLQHIKNVFHANALHFDVYTYNNFPMACGIASSASSFAALTDCAAHALYHAGYHNTTSTTMLPTDPLYLSQLSQYGSGSSCRSFFSPWALWEQHGAIPLSLPTTTLLHHCILIDTEPKAVSSTQAHQRVKRSPHFAGRPQRAQHRLHNLLQCLRNQSWEEGFHIVWEEFEDMHALFRSASPCFDYITPETRRVLDQLQQLWRYHGDGPWVTLDAGPNIHCFFRTEQKELASMLYKKWEKTYHVISGC